MRAMTGSLSKSKARGEQPIEQVGGTLPCAAATDKAINILAITVKDMRHC